MGRYAARGALDTETTKCPYAGFAAADLPWRHTPAANPAGGQLAFRPWLVLLVGTEQEIQLAGGEATLGPDVRASHLLADSSRVAHVQEADGRAVARVLSARPLQAQTAYLAVLVPAFSVTADGNVTDAWNTIDPAVVPVYDHWCFRTSPGGDFRSLATRLRAIPAAQISGIGQASLSYPRLSPALRMAVRGALVQPGSLDEPAPSVINGDLARL